MGTRGAIGFKYDGKRLLAYNHFDSYPEELGVQMLAYATDSCTEPAQQEAIKQRLDQLVQVQEGDQPDEEQIEQLKRAGVAGPERVSSGMDWYAWLRDFQGRPDEYLRVGFWPENNDFIDDHLFCELVTHQIVQMGSPFSWNRRSGSLATRNSPLIVGSLPKAMCYLPFFSYLTHVK